MSGATPDASGAYLTMDQVEAGWHVSYTGGLIKLEFRGQLMWSAIGGNTEYSHNRIQSIISQRGAVTVDSGWYE